MWQQRMTLLGLEKKVILIYVSFKYDTAFCMQVSSVTVAY